MSITNSLAPVQDPVAGSDRFRSSAQVLPLPEGLYLVSVKPSGQPLRVVNGVGFPAVQISSVPQPGTLAPAFLTKGELVPMVWLSGMDEAVITIPAGASPLLITNYLYGSELQRSPDLEIKRLNRVSTVPAVGLNIHVHIQQRGERAFNAGEWAASDEPFWIEALRVEATAAVGQLLQYHVPGASSSDGHWTPVPGRLGTPGGAPLAGIAFRLLPPLANSHRVVYAARFLRHGEMTGTDGEPCRSPQAQDPMIAVRVAIVPR